MSAPPDADVLLAMDADTLPVDVLEPVLDDVWESGAVAGVIAHYPPFPQAVGPGGDASLREAWRHLAKGLLDTPLDFSYCHTLIGSEVQHEQRVAPFYLNFGVVFFPRDAFHSIAPPYLGDQAATDATDVIAGFLRSSGVDTRNRLGKGEHGGVADAIQLPQRSNRRADVSGGT